MSTTLFSTEDISLCSKYPIQQIVHYLYGTYIELYKIEDTKQLLDHCHTLIEQIQIRNDYKPFYLDPVEWASEIVIIFERLSQLEMTEYVRSGIDSIFLRTHLVIQNILIKEAYRYGRNVKDYALATMYNISYYCKYDRTTENSKKIYSYWNEMYHIVKDENKEIYESFKTILDNINTIKKLLSKLKEMKENCLTTTTDEKDSE